MNGLSPQQTQWNAYGRIWTMPTPEERLRACEGVLASDCVYTDPNVQAKSRQELMNYMTGFQAQMPGGAFVTTAFTELHDRAMARWNMVAGDGTVVGTGVSFATFNANGELTSMTGFFDAAGSD